MPDRAPAGFVALAHVDPTIRQDLRYATDRNFAATPSTATGTPPAC
ncbi:hypothetical protein ACIA8F_07915 [Streptomyces sp. NPDC051563]